MSWPTPQDYNEAIQNPKLCFQDPELQSGQPELTVLGLPRPISGAFATVYKVKTGTKEWAVRCFTNNVKDQEKRYDAISQHLKGVNLPYFVPFEYQAKGIRVLGKWYPIVKMQWIKGDPLIPYIEKHLHNRQALLDLTSKWVRMVAALQKAQIAHGDLQHGNIMIYQNDFMLIDYDGLYVPALNGFPSNEVGHRNYQHPRRDNESFGTHIDNFSAWVIFVSLLALAIDPAIYKLLDAGEENERLLFNQEDFKSPEHSHAFRILEQISDKSFGLFVTYLQQATAMDLSIITLPNLTAQPLPTQATAKPTATSSKSSKTQAMGHPEWLSDMLGANQAQAAPALSGFSGADWVLDHLQPEVQAEGLILSLTWSRVVSYALVTAGLVLTSILFQSSPITATASSVSGLGGAFLYSGWGYRRQPALHEKRKILIKKKESEKQVAEIDKDLKKLKKEKYEYTEKEEKRIAKLVEKQRSLSQDEKNETDRIEQDLQRELNNLDSQRRKLDSDEKLEQSNALTTIQNSWLQASMMHHTVDDAKISGFGAEMKRRLKSNGIHTAADIKDIRIHVSGGRYMNEKAVIVLSSGSSISIEGIGPSKANSLLDWRKSVEQKYINRKPSSVPQSQTQAIKSKYQTKRNDLNVQEQSLKSKAQQSKNIIRTKYSNEQASLKREIDTTNQNVKTIQQGIDLQISKKTKDLSTKQWEDARIERELAPYQAISYKRYLRRLFLFRN